VKARYALALIATAFGLLAALSTVALAATVAHAANVAHAKLPPEPKAGRWRTTAQASTSGGAIVGNFTVTGKHYVAALHGTLADHAPAACGTGTLEVTGKQKIIYSNGYGWIVGGASGLEVPDKVTVKEGGQTIKASLDIFFPTFGGPAKGSLSWKHGACDLSFNASRV
jgi:hypothetical protein